jgi:hypothetical protein
LLTFSKQGRIAHGLPAEELSPFFLPFLIAIAAAANENEVAQMVSATTYRVIRVTLPVVSV